MKPVRGIGWGCALWLLGVTAAPTQAAWCNVFQVCCNSCGHPTVSNYAPDPCCNPCPQPVCTTRYVQRCYYQPVTTYVTRSYYEPVTTYRTNYYYEPVVSYRYSMYYDPCTCSYQQTACPTTSYRLRSQCCPVQSWVQRCCQVPVTTYQQASYWEPVTTCCTPPAPVCTPTSGVPVYPAPATVPGAVPGAVPEPPPAQPGVSEGRSVPVPQPGVREGTDRGYGSGSPLIDKYFPPPQSTMPPATGTGNAVRPALPPRLPVTPPQPVPLQPPPKVKLEQIVAVPAPTLKGQVVGFDNAPVGGAKLVFVNGAKQELPVTADAAGKFRVTLASGGWQVYMKGKDGQLQFHSKIDIRDREPHPVILVSR